MFLMSKLNGILIITCIITLIAQCKWDNNIRGRTSYYSPTYTCTHTLTPHCRLLATACISTNPIIEQSRSKLYSKLASQQTITKARLPQVGYTPQTTLAPWQHRPYSIASKGPNSICHGMMYSRGVYIQAQTHCLIEAVRNTLIHRRTKGTHCHTPHSVLYDLRSDPKLKVTEESIQVLSLALLCLVFLLASNA